MILPVAAVFLSAVLCAQSAKTIPAKPATNKPIKDSFAFNVLATVDKILRVAEEAKKHPMTLAGEPLKTNYNGGMTYKSAVQLLGSEKAEFCLNYTRRDAGNTEWIWMTTVIDTPKGAHSAAVLAMHKKLDSLLLSFKDRGKLLGPNFSFSTWASVNEASLERDFLFLKISFEKGIYNTEQGVIDSMIRLYKPLLSDKTTANECGEKFSKAMQLEGISAARIKQIYEDIVKEIAYKDINTAFQLMLGAPYFVEMKTLKEQLTYSQQEEITKLATKVVEDYNAKYNGKPKPDVVLEKKKEIEKVTPPSDPCKREIWDLKIKPGWYVTGSGHTAYVRDYSCSTHTYTISWVNPTKKLVTEKGITVDAMNAYSPTSASPFIVCSHCNGVGYSMEYDWYQVNVASNHYAKSNDQRKYSCGVCSGAGYLKIR